MASAVEPSKTPPARVALRVFVVLLAVAFWAYALFGAEGFQHQQERLQHRDRLRQDLEGERAQNERLRQDLEALRSDDHRIEEEVRTRLDYQRPGELVLMSDDATARRSGSTAVVAPPVPREVELAAARRLAAAAKAAVTAPVNGAVKSPVDKAPRTAPPLGGGRPAKRVP